MTLNQWCEAARGRQAALAAHLRVKPPTVARWLSRERPIPLDHCPFIQEFTASEVTCEELRPDARDYFALIRAQATPATSQQPAPAGTHAQES
jgi:DNA-binding transcriptional regulator YdaS (Cro superfamily)